MAVPPGKFKMVANYRYFGNVTDFKVLRTQRSIDKLLMTDILYRQDSRINVSALCVGVEKCVAPDCPFLSMYFHVASDNSAQANRKPWIKQQKTQSNLFPFTSQGHPYYSAYKRGSHSFYIFIWIQL